MITEGDFIYKHGATGPYAKDDVLMGSKPSYLKIKRLAFNRLLSVYISFTFLLCDSTLSGGGRVVRWCWVNLQCRGVLQFGLQ